MDRVEIIRALLRNRKSRNYLEIGVFNGHVLFRVRSRFKLAVDPEFRFSGGRKLLKTVLNPYNLFNRYIPKTSDAFFAEDAPELLADRKIDLALIDGMHEYEYALRDVENTLRYLSPTGVIVMHDCNPISPEANYSYEKWKASDFAGTWNGDVWRTIMFLRTRHDINVFVLDCDHGLGIIQFGTPESTLPFTRDQIESFQYEDLDQNRREWLNLKQADYFYEYFRVRK